MSVTVHLNAKFNVKKTCYSNVVSVTLITKKVAFFIHTFLYTSANYLNERSC